MPAWIERQPRSHEVVEHAEEASPLTIERKEVVVPTPSQFSAQVLDDNGQPIIQTPSNMKVTITIPTTQSQLEVVAKGSIENAGTWSSVYWLRMIKKALFFGWNIITGKNSAEPIQKVIQ